MRAYCRVDRCGAVLIELGSGASRKVRMLLEVLRPRTYIGVDISREFLLDATRRLAKDFPSRGARTLRRFASAAHARMSTRQAPRVLPRFEYR